MTGPATVGGSVVKMTTPRQGWSGKRPKGPCEQCGEHECDGEECCEYRGCVPQRFVDVDTVEASSVFDLVDAFEW